MVKVRERTSSPEPTRTRDPFKMLEEEKQREQEAESSEEKTPLVLGRSPLAGKKVDLPEVKRKPAIPEDALPKAESTIDYGPEWIRQGVTSRSVPYNGANIFIRTLTMPILSKIYASHTSKSFTLLVDALGHCVRGIDIRDLTPSDFNFLMYWIRDNSFPQAPLQVRWLSRYNNENNLSISKRDLQQRLVELQMTAEEYAEYQAQGLCFPTVRDMELLQSEDLSPDDQWLLDYAQYVAIPPEEYGNYTENKVQRLNTYVTERGLSETIALIDEFSSKIEHGVQEEFRIRDPKFKADTAAIYLENVAKGLLNTVDLITDRDGIEEVVMSTISRANAFLAEAAALRNAIENEETVQAVEEVVALSINATDFFPSLRQSVS